MYTKRIRLLNYGPVIQVDITLPFEEDIPKPVVFVGENGSGKSILLSHIVNGLMAAKGVVYSESPEVETGKVFKLRSGLYIRSGDEYYFATVDFQEDLFMGEIRSRHKKDHYVDGPAGLGEGDAKNAWDQMDPDSNEHLIGNIGINNKSKIETIFSNNCVLYFPSNRYEEPAWLNEDNLKSRARYMDRKHRKGQTNRKVISYSPLRDNQDWLFEIIYDSFVFEIQTGIYNPEVDNKRRGMPLSILLGYSGHATSTCQVADSIVRKITKNPNATLKIGRRHSRVVSLKSDKQFIAPNIFQLSSGETALMNLFLSILRDFDLCNIPFNSAAEIRGIVVVDEIDMHLHAVHQHEVLPELMRMFPKIQFVVTTHSPLFVLGMKKTFGEDGFSLYRLPEGHQISPEEFSEFGDAYHAFTRTSKFENDTRKAIELARKPIVFVEGTTDQKYIETAARLLGDEEILERVDIRDGRGKDNMRKVWNHFHPLLNDIIRQKVLLLFDCDYHAEPSDKEGRLFRRTVPLNGEPTHPIQTGIENLFSRKTLDKARWHNEAFVDVVCAHEKTERGITETVPEGWTVNANEKKNLCDWLCRNGTPEDFQHFQTIFDSIEEALGWTPSRSGAP